MKSKLLEITSVFFNEEGAYLLGNLHACTLVSISLPIIIRQGRK
jgi:hypothetical protein